VIRRPTTRDYLGISVFWLAMNFFWGAMLFVVVQSRVQALVRAEQTPVAARAAVPATAAQIRYALKHPGHAEKVLEAETNRRLGWMLGIGALISTLTQLLFGALSDNSRHPAGRRRPFVVIGTAASNLGVVAFFLAHSYIWLFGSWMFIQFFLSIALGPYQALLPDLIPLEHEGTAAAYMGLWQLIGRAGGMVAGAFFLQYRWGLVGLTVLFLMLLNGLMVATVMLTRERPLRHRFPGGVFGSIGKMFRVELRRHPSFIWVLISRLCINMGIYTVEPFIQYYLMHVFGLTKEQTLQKQILIGLIVNLAGVSAAFPAGVLSDRYPKKFIVYFACGVCIAGGVGFAVSGSVAMALIAGGVFGFGYGAFASVDWALVCNVLPPGQPAKYMGLWSLGDTLPQIVAPMFGYMIVNFMIAHYNPNVGYRTAMAAAMIWFTLGTVCIRYVKEHKVSVREEAIEHEREEEEIAARG